jgi:formylglycine-generating enzyme required for sulfatase activity
MWVGAALLALAGGMAVLGTSPDHSSPEKVYARTGVELVLIPAGSFQMGSPFDEEGRGFAEGPQHEVCISQPFWMAKHEVTNAQYRRFVVATSHRRPAYWDDASLIAPDQPVVGVSWDDAVAWCEWAGMSLPSEAQWEYAARAGTGTRFWSGDSEADLARVGWYSENSGNGTQAVGQKPANAWGLHDMHGNVWNWTADWYGGYSPVGQTDPTGPTSGQSRVFRGGSWVDLALGARAAVRMWHEPLARGRVLGFRPTLAIARARGGAFCATSEDEPSTGSTSALDRDGRRRGWAGEYNDGKKVGPWATWHGNGQKGWQGEYQDGVIGKSTTWHPNGQKASQYQYRNGLQHGAFTSWHPNGQKARNGVYEDGDVGQQTCWNEAGEEAPCPD